MKLMHFIKKLALCSLLIFFGMSTVFSAPENPAFKEWCVETFNNGSEIYEAYRVINFDIEYKSDRSSGSFDFWQKPEETLLLKTGDCEDVMFLFSDMLPWNQDNFEIVWGFAYSKISIAKTKHVWGQLTAKDGQIYILEGNGGDWDSIKKQEIVEKYEYRDPFVVMSQRMYTLLQGVFLDYDIFDETTYRDIFGKDGEPSTEAFEVLRMLHEMITRERI